MPPPFDEHLLEISGDPEFCARAADLLAEATGLTKVFVLVIDPWVGTLLDSGASRDFDPDVIVRYQREFAKIDPYLSAMWSPLGEVTPDWSKLSQAAIENTPFVQDWLDTPGVDSRWTAGARLPLLDGKMGVFGTGRPRGAGPIQRKELARAQAIMGPLTQALDFHRAAGLPQVGAADSLRRTANADAVILVRADGTVSGGDEAAERLLQSGAFLTKSRGRLLAANGFDRPLLDALLGQLAEPGPVSDEAVVFLRMADGRPGIRVRLLGNLAQGQFSQLPPGTAGALLLDDFSRPRRLSPAALAQTGLTASEAALATLLLEGASLQEIAAQRGVAKETVRSQLKSLMAKLGVNRQAELLRFLTRLAQ